MNLPTAYTVRTTTDKAIVTVSGYRATEHVVLLTTDSDDDTTHVALTVAEARSLAVKLLVAIADAAGDDDE